MRRLVGTVVVLGLIGGAVWIGLVAGPSDEPPAIHPVTSNEAASTDEVTITSCSDVHIPSNVEVDTNLDRKNGLLTVNYGSTPNRSVTVAYRRDNCSWTQNRSIRRVIVHALTTALEDESRGTYVVAECFDPVRRPRHMVLACADFGLRGNAIEWSSWTKNRAEGRGNFVMKDLTAPDFGLDRRQGRIVLFGRRYCVRLERFTFWKGSIDLDRPVRGQEVIDIYPMCGTGRRTRAPSSVEDGRAVILEAAKNSDYEALRQILKPERFLSDFGYGVDPIDRWAEMGDEPLELMAALLRMGHVTENSNEGQLTRWPTYDADTKSLDDIKDRDRDLFLSVMSPVEFRRLVPNDEYGYVGPRLGILENGTWWFFIMEPGP